MNKKLIQLNDILLYPLWQNPFIFENITSFINSYSPNNIKNSNVSDVLKHFDQNLSELKKINLYYKIYHNIHILAIHNHISHFKSQPKWNQ